MDPGPDCITTLPFRVSRGRMVRFLLMRHALWWLSALIVIAIGFIIAGIAVDLRLCILGLILVCMCLPMTAAMVLITHGLAQMNALNVLLHRVVITPDAVVVTVLSQTDEDAGERIEKSIEIDRDRLGAYTVIVGAIAVPVRSAGSGQQRMDGVLMLPYTAFDNTDMFRRAISMLPRG